MSNIPSLRPVKRILDTQFFKFCPNNSTQYSTIEGVRVNDEVNTTFLNRNPRNLERLRIGYKPSGYHLESTGRDFWHKLVLQITHRHVTAKVIHYTGPTVVTASTNEWAIKKFLYRSLNVSSYYNLGRVFAERCLESGLTEVQCDLKTPPGGKVEAFIKAVTEGGVSLAEPERFLPHRPWDQHRPEKPWEVQE